MQIVSHLEGWTSAERQGLALLGTDSNHNWHGIHIMIKVPCKSTFFNYFHLAAHLLHSKTCQSASLERLTVLYAELSIKIIMGAAKFQPQCGLVRSQQQISLTYFLLFMCVSTVQHYKSISNYKLKLLSPLCSLPVCRQIHGELSNCGNKPERS